MISTSWSSLRQGTLSGNPLPISDLKLEKLKGKSNSAAVAKANKMINLANKQTSLGAKFKSCGIQTYGSDKASFYAVSSLFDDLVLQGYLSFEVVRTLEGSLFGYPDKEFIPGGWKTAAVALLVPPVGGLIAAVEYNRPNLQKWTVDSMTSQEALDTLGKVDPGAADLVANAILKQQEGFAKKYITPMTTSFANGAWRGASAAIKVIAETVGGAASILPWWIKASVGMGIILMLHNKFGKK